MRHSEEETGRIGIAFDRFCKVFGFTQGNEEGQLRLEFNRYYGWIIVQTTEGGGIRTPLLTNSVSGEEMLNALYLAINARLRELDGSIR